ncbi:serine/threonine protein kinase [Bacillus songklensis]|uniref:Serine/threonine protein kinase n=1 Tax=Bacillus songklensis TaxID=1069116 RepID=A0ABV8B4K0_9BACI
MIRQVVERIYTLVMDRPLKKGTVVAARYMIKRVLGMGSYGISYVAWDLVNNVDVVLKQARKTKIKMAKGKKAFEYEAKLLQILSHPNIPSLHEVIQNKQGHFLVMDYIQGDTFEDLIFREGKSFSEREMLNIVWSILDITVYFHSQGIVHRDLRIPNILCVDGQIFIIDFGLARFLHDMPEEIDDGFIEKKLMREISVQSDIYALGHFMLFLLYSGYEPTSLLEKSWEEELNLSGDLTRIIRKMLQLDPPYETVESLREDMIHYLDGNEIGRKEDGII